MVTRQTRKDGCPEALGIREMERRGMTGEKCSRVDRITDDWQTTETFSSIARASSQCQKPDWTYPSSTTFHWINVHEAGAHLFLGAHHCWWPATPINSWPRRKGTLYVSSSFSTILLGLPNLVPIPSQRASRLKPFPPTSLLSLITTQRASHSCQQPQPGPILSHVHRKFCPVLVVSPHLQTLFPVFSHLSALLWGKLAVLQGQCFPWSPLRLLSHCSGIPASGSRVRRFSLASPYDFQSTNSSPSCNPSVAVNLKPSGKPLFNLFRLSPCFPSPPDSVYFIPVTSTLDSESQMASSRSHPSSNPGPCYHFKTALLPSSLIQKAYSPICWSNPTAIVPPTSSALLTWLLYFPPIH